MKKYFAIGILTIIVVYFITTCNRKDHLLPGNYNISTQSTFSTGLSYNRVLQVKETIKIKELATYPLEYRASRIRPLEKTLTEWTMLDRLESKDGIISNLRQTLDFEYHKEIEELLNQIEINNQSIYFAGHGQVMLGKNNQKVNHYQYKYFLNLKTKKIYEFDMIY